MSPSARRPRRNGVTSFWRNGVTTLAPAVATLSQTSSIAHCVDELVWVATAAPIPTDLLRSAAIGTEPNRKPT